MLSGGNQTDGNTLKRFLTPYQYSRLPLMQLLLKFKLLNSLGLLEKCWGHFQHLKGTKFMFIFWKVVKELTCMIGKWAKQSL